MQDKPNIAIIVGSTRPGRNASAVADWVSGIASAREEATFECIDLADIALPFLDEPLSARAAGMMERDYARAHTSAWSRKVAAFDGFVFVVPEYNRGIPAVLKNALDFLYREWNDKAAAIVTYGAQGGARASAQLRQSLGELHVATVAAEVNLFLYSDFENFTTFKPDAVHLAGLGLMLDQLVAWSRALRPVRAA